MIVFLITNYIIKAKKYGHIDKIYKEKESLEDTNNKLTKHLFELNKDMKEVMNYIDNIKKVIPGSSMQKNDPMESAPLFYKDGVGDTIERKIKFSKLLTDDSKKNMLNIFSSINERVDYLVRVIGSAGIFEKIKFDFPELIEPRFLDEDRHPESSMSMQLAKIKKLESLAMYMPIRNPVKNFQITSTFGVRYDPLNKKKTQHNGIDLKSAHHAPVYPSGAGKVVFAGSKNGYGKVVDVDHGYGFTTRYAHLSSIKVAQGDKVYPIQQIGLQGSTGSRCTGEHLHFEVSYAGKKVNPHNFIYAIKNVNTKSTKGKRS